MSTYLHKRLIILYGSQTGNSQDIAERIWRESKLFHFRTSVTSLDEYDISNLLIDECVVFVCSTTGQGDVPDNMKKFWKLMLKKNLPENLLAHLKYAVLGLGDSSYIKFNFIAKKLHKRLQQLGATSVIDIGLGDDQHDLGYDAVVDPWINNLWNNLLTLYPLPQNIEVLPKANLVNPRWKISTKLLSHAGNVVHSQSIYYSTRKSDHFDVTVLMNERITDVTHFQEVKLIKLKTEGQVYQPGDIIVLRPRNLKWKIEEFYEVLINNGVKIDHETIFSLEKNDSDMPVPHVLKNPVKFSQLCEEYFDLMSVPRRHTFEVLGNITDNDLEKEKCEEFTTAEGQEELYSYCNRPKRNIVEVLQDFPHATKNLTLELLFEIFPPLKPREFSIASSFHWHKNEIHILLAVVKYKTKLLKERYGLCSNYLAGVQVDDVLTAWLKRGSFRFPKNDTPVIMVGPGTGFAPFRNFIYERVFQNIASSENSVLFFGCRNEMKDFHCKDELQKLHSERKIELICAFSRDQKEKVYVQDKIREHKSLVWKLIQKGCFIYIAGNAKFMPQDVRIAFIDVIKSCGFMDEEASDEYLSKLEKDNRYQTECW